MGTRADFYIRKGIDLDWLGSIAWDGYPSGIEKSLLNSETGKIFISEVAALLMRDDGTTPAMGWPWPWDDSNTTDYSYIYEGGKVMCSSFGSPAFDPLVEIDDPEESHGHKFNFPCMKGADHSAKAGTKRSGLMVFNV